MNFISAYHNLRAGLVSLVVACLLLHGGASGQQYDSIAAHYKNEDAVIVNYTQRLVLTVQDGKLVANSYVTREKLFLSDLSRGTHNHDYLFHSDFNQLNDLKATLKLPGKNGYKEVPCYNFADINPDRDNVFYDDNRLVVISYSGIVKNAVTKTYYSVEHTDLHLLPPFYFQEDMPVVSATYEVVVPRTVKMKFALSGYDTARISQAVKETDNNTVYTFTVKDVPAMKEFDNVPSPWYYITQVIPYIASYRLSETDKKVKMLAKTDQLYRYMYHFVRGLNMKEDSALNKKVAEITRKDKTDREKARDIYRWVQGHMHYIAFEKGLEGFTPREAATVLSREYGDCKDMTAILVTMCRKAGLDAHYTWIGTREKPYSWETTPLPMVANHMICALKLDGDWIFMDGTHPYIPFGKAPDGIQGKEALIGINDTEYKILKVPVAGASQNTIRDSTLLTFEGSHAKGNYKIHYKGAPAWRFGTMLMYLKGDDREKYLRSQALRGSDEFVQGTPVAETGIGPEKEALLEGQFTVDNYVLRNKKNYYVNMNLKHTFEDERIDTAGRNVPWYYDHPQTVEETVVLDIPKGYRVAHVPESAHGAVPGIWKYAITYKTTKTRVIMTRSYELATTTVQPGQFAAVNAMADHLDNLYKETVVLTAR